MANYATLKANIIQDIKQNGENLITGQLLQQHLLAMVNSLGVGYQYAGIATPATNPGTPDQNVFYLASTAGTYTNFGGIVLADGEIAILKYNGTWSKDSTGAASLEKVNQLERDRVKKAPGKNIFDPTDPDILIGKYINYAGTIGTSAAYNASGYIPVEENQTYYVASNSSRPFRFVCPYDENKNVIPVSASGFDDVRSFTTPAGCAFVRVSFYASDYSVAQVSLQNSVFEQYNPIDGYLGGVKERLDGFDDEFNSLYADTLPKKVDVFPGVNLFNPNDPDVLIGKYINYAGTIVISASYNASGYIPVEENQTYYVASNSSRPFRFVCPYDENKNVIPVSASGFDDVRSFTTPAGCAFVRVSFYASDYSVAQVSLKNTPFEQYNPIGGYVTKENERIADIENELDAFPAIFVEQNPSINLFNSLAPGVLIGKFITYVGTIGSGDYNASDYIPVEENKTYYIASDSAHGFRFVCPYDENKNVISVSATGFEDVRSFVTPAGCKYVRVSFYASDYSVAQVSLQNTPFEQYNPIGGYLNGLAIDTIDKLLGGKKIYTCGDSYTHGDYSGEPDINAHKFQDGQYAGQNKVWPFFIGQRTGAIVTNLAVNGGRMTTTPGWETTNPDACFSYLLYQQVPADVDYIIIKYGINDETGIVGGVISLGTIDSTDINTFYGAWNTVLSWYIENRPKAKIGIIVSNDINNTGVIEAVINIAKKYGIKYLNEATDENFPYFYRQFRRSNVASSVRTARDNYYKMNANNSHPNDACQEYESSMIEAFIRTL